MGRTEGVVDQPARREFSVSAEPAQAVRRSPVTWLHVPHEPVITAEPPPAPPVVEEPVVAAPRPKSTFVHFPLNSAKPLDVVALDDLARIVHAGDIQAVTAVGHADDRGTDAFNDKLARERARIVARLIGKRYGLTVEVESHGRREPIADNSTESGRAQNRRVEIIVKEPHSHAGS